MPEAIALLYDFAIALVATAAWLAIGGIALYCGIYAIEWVRRWLA